MIIITIQPTAAIIYVVKHHIFSRRRIFAYNQWRARGIFNGRDVIAHKQYSAVVLGTSKINF